jgi:hypothetical protein
MTWFFDPQLGRMVPYTGWTSSRWAPMGSDAAPAKMSQGEVTVVAVVTVDDVRALARTLPRTSEHLIHDRIKFRVGAIVYVAFSRDERTMGFGYPKEQRHGLIAAEPDLFFLPRPSDLRFNWACCHLDRLDHDQMTEAWRIVVPKFLARQRLSD